MTNKLGDKSYSIEFETGSSTIKEISKDILDRIFVDVTATDGTKVIVSGHTDNTGSPQINKNLSEARAKSVADYLISKGIPVVRVSSVGYGQDKPIADNSTSSGRAKNRRVSIELMGR
jgi:outer membrane protein OmpA-like peptidoglycan-associated protein